MKIVGFNPAFAIDAAQFLVSTLQSIDILIQWQSKIRRTRTIADGHVIVYWPSIWPKFGGYVVFQNYGFFVSNLLIPALFSVVTFLKFRGKSRCIQFINLHVYSTLKRLRCNASSLFCKLWEIEKWQFSFPKYFFVQRYFEFYHMNAIS